MLPYFLLRVFYIYRFFNKNVLYFSQIIFAKYFIVFFVKYASYSPLYSARGSMLAGTFQPLAAILSITFLAVSNCHVPT